MKVVCKKDYPKFATHVPVRKGQILTVREKFLCPAAGRYGYRFKEITNPVCDFWGQERGYDRAYFERVVKTDISIFTAMLAPTPKEKVNENA